MNDAKTTEKVLLQDPISQDIVGVVERPTQRTDRAVAFASGANLSPPKATLTITQNDIDIANDICEAIEQQISPELRVKLFNQAVARIAMERLK